MKARRTGRALIRAVCIAAVSILAVLIPGMRAAASAPIIIKMEDGVLKKGGEVWNITQHPFPDGHFQELQLGDGSYILETDITTTAVINIPLFEEVSLDLNGHTIRRNLDAPADHGSVIELSSWNSDACSLVLSDHSAQHGGKITGGNTTGDGGAISWNSYGQVQISNVIFEGNHAEGNGGALCIPVWQQQPVSISGETTITRNTAGGGGGGIYMDMHSSLTLAGQPVIQGNLSGAEGRTDNLCRNGASTIGISGALGEGAWIGISETAAGEDVAEGVFATGSGYDLTWSDAEKFHPDRGHAVAYSQADRGAVAFGAPIPYVGADGTETTSMLYVPVVSSDVAVTWNAGVYAVTEDAVIGNQVTLARDVEVILCNGKTLELGGIPDGEYYLDGADHSLTVYGQAESDIPGMLLVTAVDEYGLDDIENYRQCGGTVRVECGDRDFTYGLHAKTVHISGGLYDLVLYDDAVGRGEGIRTHDGIDGDRVIRVTGGIINVQNARYGIRNYDSGDIEISGGCVTATNNEFHSILSYGGISISGGVISASSINYQTIYADGRLSVTGGNVTAEAQRAGMTGLYGNSVSLSWTDSDQDRIHGSIGVSAGSVSLEKGFVFDEPAHEPVTVSNLNDHPDLYRIPAYRVTYRNGDAVYQIDTIPAAEGTFTFPAGPSRDGYLLQWCADSALTTVYDQASPLTSDLTLYAKWRRILSADGIRLGSLTYNGAVQDPEVTFDGTVLVKGRDYTVSCSPATVRNAGSYTAVFTGTGAYAGTVTAPFPVSPKEVTVGGITAAAKTYDGTRTAVLRTENAVITGMAAGDDLTVTATGTFADANAGADKTVTISGLTLGGTEASNYVLSASGQQTTTSAEIAKALPTAVAPTAKTGLTENGSAQQLVNPGSATGGTMQYALTETDAAPNASAYTAAVPTAAGAGTYYVWYRTVGDANHSDLVPGRITVTIAAKPAEERPDTEETTDTEEPTDPEETTNPEDAAEEDQFPYVDTFDQTVNGRVHAFVARMYAFILNRAPEEEGIEFWADLILNQGMPAAECARFFVLESDEFLKANVNNDVFLSRMYKTFFGEGRNRDNDPEGFAFWKTLLEQGYSRKWVLAGFVGSPEFSGICDSYGITRGEITLTEEDDQPSDANLYVDEAKVNAYVERLYNTILGRPAEAGGKEFWAGLISRHEMTAQRVALEGFFFSDEYLAKETSNAEFVNTLYLSLLDRDPADDPEGFAFWVSALDNGMDRMTVIEQGFGDSPEFRGILQSYGLLRK